MNLWIFIIGYILIIGSVAYLGIRIAKSKVDIFKEYPRAFYWFICGWLMFMGCFLFPLSLNVFILYCLFFSCFSVAYIFKLLYGAGKWKRVCLTTLLFSSAGLVCRYLLEYGEVSNTYNFTVWKVILYLGVVVGMVVGGYQLVSREKL